MGVHDDEYDENTDWRAKYLEAADMLAETRAELDDFQHSSKELEEELERELERTERAQDDLKNKVVRAEAERDDWKTRFMSLQTTHNTTTTSLQRELDQLRQTHHQLKSQMRELEIGNDDLEGRERAVASSLADLEARYAKVLEEKILLEQELLDKATLEEECQRLKDEARDLGEEVYVLKEQLNEARSNAHLAAPSSSSLPPVPSRTSSMGESLLSTAPPDLLLSELTEVATTPLDETPLSARPAAASVAMPTPVHSGQSAVLQRAGFIRQNSIPSTSGALSRSSTMPSISPTRLPMRDPARPSPSPRPQIPTYTSSTRTNTLNSSTSSTSKSKGVQMVSEMRARVRTLEQKLHTRVPRLRMGSISGRNTSNGSNDSLPKEPTASKEKAVASGKEKERERLKGAESPGWVLIMEEGTPQPKSRRSADSGGSRSSTEVRRTGSPAVPSSYHPAQSTYAGSSSASASGGTRSSASASGGVRRPASRLSASTDGRSSIGSTISTLSSATTTSRPTTPTFLPIPSSSFRTSTNATPSSSGLPGRRTSLGPPAPPTPRSKERPTSVPMGGRPFANGHAGGSGMSGLDKSQIGIPRSMSKQLPSLPSMTNLTATPRPGSGTASPNPLSQSRIGRPPSAFTGIRRPAATVTQDDSATGTSVNGANLKASTRLRAGSFKS